MNEIPLANQLTQLGSSIRYTINNVAYMLNNLTDYICYFLLFFFGCFFQMVFDRVRVSLFCDYAFSSASVQTRPDLILK